MSASSRFVRPSRFRHVFAETVKPENQFLDLELSPVTGDHNYVRGNGKFFSVAVRGGGGPVQAIPYSQIGKLPRGYPTINGHAAAVYDTAWNPFNDNVLATGSDDTTIKLWSIPDGGLTETLKEALITLSGHGKPVSLLQWHPTASNVIASVSKDPSIKVWDAERGTAVVTLEGFGGLVQDLAFNNDGNQLVTSCKDKQAKIFDVRAGAAVNDKWEPHEGSKAFKALFLGDRGQLLTVGFTKQSKREFKLWDAKALAAPLTTVEVDQSAGVMLPFYDDDTRMLYLTGKGDGNIRYYEFVDEAPFIYPLAEHRTNVSTKGADMLPKRACNVMKCEVARFLKLTNDSVEPISFIVPRKSEAFQDDIFPEAIAGVPTLSASEWFGGASGNPKRVSLDPAKAGSAPKAAPAAAYKPVAIASPTPSPAPSPAPAPATSPAPVASPAPVHGAGAVLASPPAPAPSPAPHATTQTSFAESPATGGSDQQAAVDALTSQVKSLSAELADAHARIAELEASEAKLKRALAAFSS